MSYFIQVLQDQTSLFISTLGILIILFVATLGYLILLWRQPSPGLSKIGSRIRFLWWMAGTFLVSILFSHKLLILYIATLAFLGLKEFLSITPTRRADRRVLFWAYLAIPIQFFFVWMGWYPAFITFVPLYIFIVIPLVMVIIGEIKGLLKAWSMLSWGITTNVYTLGHLAYLLLLPSSAAPHETTDTITAGFELFLFLISLDYLNHVAQFYFGRLFDHPRLNIKVSTTRNWASLLGSLVTTTIISWLAAPILTPLTQLESIAIGMLVAVAGFVGYITMTAIKSDLQLKDRSSMTPGHGGVLNRIDTIIYSAPLFFHMISYLHF